jgi:hypothetical protein
MKIKSTLAILGMAVITIAASCGESKEKAVASDLCGCAETLENKLSPTMVKIIVESANSSNPDQSIQSRMTSLDSTQRLAIMPDMEVISELADENGEFLKCMKGVGEKYENTNFIIEKSLKKVFDEMEKMNCAFGVAILKMN